MGHDTPRDSDQGDLAPNDQRLFNEGDDTSAASKQQQDPANVNDARDERDLSEEAETLANSIIGQSVTPDGTKTSDAGKDNKRGYMSFGIVQLGQVSASLGHGEIVQRCLKHLVNGFWLNNLASMHNRRALFNMDISGGQPSVIIKALADSFPGKIRLLPALPKAWDKGTIEGILCRGVITIKRLHWDKNQVEVEMTSAKNQEIILTLPAAINEIKGKGAAVADGANTSECKLTLLAGHKVSLQITLR